MLHSFFAPQGVAVVGASQNPAKLGYGVARNLVVSGYQGEIHFVNPHGGRLFDRPIYPNVASVPDPVDLAMILIPGPVVPQALEECGRRGIQAVIIGSGGFREVGPEGKALEERCLEIAHRHEMRVIGPNCIGLLDTHLPIDATFLPLPGPIPGDIAFLSHSGAICEAVIDWARGQGFGLSRLVSLGNQMDLTEGDVLAPTAADPHTRVVAMYLEGVGDGRSFIQQARRVTRSKPVVAIKVGRSARGQEAVASHTGALAGRDAAFDAAFRKAGIIRAESSEEMFNWARALAWCPLPGGRRTAVLTNAGGPGAIATDALGANGLEMAELGRATRNALQRILPPAASVRNPVDMLASAGPLEFASCLGALLGDEGVDGVMVILLPPPMTTAAEVAGAITPLIRLSDKPVVVALMGEDLISHASRLFRQAHVPDYRFPERAASALRVLAVRQEQLTAPQVKPSRPAGIRREAARSLLSKAPRGRDGFLAVGTAAQILQAYKIAAPATELGRSPGEAARAAERIGYPVVLKIASADVTHKSDIGGVLLGVERKQEVIEGFERVRQAARRVAPKARIEGVWVQESLPPGQEVIVGVVRDSQFGPLVMFGSGGVEVEGLNDVAFALAPLTSVEAGQIIDSTWAGRRLRGFRSLPAADRASVLEVVMRLAQLAADFPEISEVEINPLRVWEVGQGAAALDVRLRVTEE
jgi:acetyl coenzyme A synthetase (ADP forming)-like protein